MKRTAAISCILTLCVLIGCSRNGLVSSTGGSSSEVVGKVLYVNGQPARSAVVRLRGSDFLADTSLVGRVMSSADARTDDSGAFALNVVKGGNYSIEVNDLMGNAVLIGCSVNATDTVTIPIDTLKPTGSITGAIGSSGQGVNVFVQVYGLERVTLISTSSSGFVISDVPNGQYTIRIVASGSANAANKIGDVKVVSGDQTEMGTLDLASPVIACDSSRKLVINTSYSGANVFNNVYNFPVLVRLRANNFSFNKAMKNGEDVRFTRPDSSELPFEIERWDSLQQQAEIWVKVDTVFGNSASQFITLRWGNSNAVSQSNSCAVFDTANGFQGVWHFAQQGNGVASDATGNHFDGMAMGMNATASAQGNIGLAQEFDGVSSYIQIPGTANSVLNFPENGHYSVSAWVNADTLDTMNHCIFSKGHEQYYLKQKWSMTPVSTWEFVEYHDNQGWESTDVTAVSNTWKYLVGIRAGNKQYLYVDGALVDSTYDVYYGYVPRNTGNDCTIGRFLQSVTVPGNDGFCYFKGRIDEVRVSNDVPGPDWIKLCYMNQKANDALVVFK